VLEPNVTLQPSFGVVPHTKIGQNVLAGRGDNISIRVCGGAGLLVIDGRNGLVMEEAEDVLGHHAILHLDGSHCKGVENSLKLWIAFHLKGQRRS